MVILGFRLCLDNPTLPKITVVAADPSAASYTMPWDTTAAPPGRLAGMDVAEITRLVRSPDAANNQGLVFLLYRLAGDLVIKNDIRVILSSVRRNHMPFYRRIGFVDVAGPRAYPGLNCPMHLLSCSRTEYDRVRMAFPLMNPAASPTGTFDGFENGRAVSMPLIPLSLAVDLLDVGVAAQRAEALWREPVPGGAAGIDNGVVVIEQPVREEALAQV